MITLLLSYPPSLNALYRRSGPRIYKAAAYQEYVAEARRMLAQQNRPTEPLTEPFALEVAVGRPDRRRRDLDNLWKVLLDVCQDLDLYEDDSLIHDERIYWCPHVTGLQIMLFSLEEADPTRLLRGLP